MVDGEYEGFLKWWIPTIGFKTDRSWLGWFGVPPMTEETSSYIIWSHITIYYIHGSNIYILYILYMYIICTYECWFILNMEDLWSSSYHNPKFTTGHLSDVSVSPAGHTGQGWPIGVSINGGTPIAGWFVPWKIHLQMDDLGVSLFQETSIWI